MHCLRSFGLAMAILASGFFTTTAWAGEGAPYLVLKSSSGSQTIPVEARPYAYGWFGAKSQPQYGRSFGYYRNYTQWRQW